MKGYTSSGFTKRLGLLFFAASMLIVGGCGLNRDSDFGSGPSKPRDTTVTAMRPLDTDKPVDTLRVGSLNMSIGFPVAQLLFLDVGRDSVAYRALDTIATRYRKGLPQKRIALMAQAIADAKLDLVALQEVLIFATNEETPYDFFNALKTELQRITGVTWSGLRHVLNDTVLSATWGSRSLRVAFAEGNAVLMRQGWSWSDTSAVDYKMVLPIEIEGAKPSMRNYVRAKVTGPKGSTWQIYNTHLEVLEPFRSAQAAELAQAMTEQRRYGEAQLALGDFNDEPEQGAPFIMKEAGLRDVRDLAGAAKVITCCVEDSHLWDAAAALSGRVLDYVFAFHVLGAATWQGAWSTALPLGDGTSLWASDHVLVYGQVMAQ